VEQGGTHSKNNLSFSDGPDGYELLADLFVFFYLVRNALLLVRRPVLGDFEDERIMTKSTMFLLLFIFLFCNHGRIKVLGLVRYQKRSCVEA
jgi:hypothetical protein